MNKINVVLVGVGHDHAHDAFMTITKNNSGFNLLGIIKEDNDNNNYSKWEKDYSKFQLLTLIDALNLKNLDAVIIESDDSTLTKYALEFAKKGINIHMDKPGGQDKNEFDELIKICKSNNTTLHLGYMYRYNPSIKEAIDVCQSGKLGNIISVDSEMSIYHPYEKRKWLNNFKGGMMNFLGCHLIDLIIYLQGKPDSVTSFNSSSIDSSGNDLSLAVLKYKNVYSTIKTNCVNYYGFNTRHITINLEKGSIVISPIEFIKDNKLYSKAIYALPALIEGVPCGEIIYGPYDRYDEMFLEFKKICDKEISNKYSLDYEKLVHDVLLSCEQEFGKEIKL